MKNFLNLVIGIMSIMLIFSCNQDLDLPVEDTKASVEQEQDLRTCGHAAHMDVLMQNEDYRVLRQELMLNLKEEAVDVESRALCSDPVVLPVAVHYQGVTSPNATCLIALAQSQIDILNQDFQGTNTDISTWNSNASYFPGVSNGETCIEFVLANTNHPSGYGLSNGDLAVTINQTTGDQDSDWSGYINFFVQPNTGLLGYSPLGGAGNGDGVVIDANAFGSGNGCGSVSPNSPYNLGRTLTHELGHYLNLDHIWADAGCNNSDLVSDTPNQNNENYGCPSIPQSSCGTNDLSMNYMDYVNDACMYMFTNGQSNRMENWVNANLTNVSSNASTVISGGGGSGGGSGGGTPVTCGIPTQINATVTGTSTTTVSWGAESGAIKYRVRYRKVGTTTWSLKTVATPSVALTGLQSGSKYQYRVRTRCASGWTPYSPLKTFTTQANPGGGSGGSSTNTIKLRLKLDDYPEETTWELVDDSGDVVDFGGPYPVSKANKLISKTLSIPDGDYTLYVDDSYGDGICCQYGNGYIKLRDVNNVLFANHNGNFGTYAEIDFEVYDNVAEFGGGSSDDAAPSLVQKTRVVGSF